MIFIITLLLDGLFLTMLNIGETKYWSNLTSLVLRYRMSARLPPLSVGQLQEKHRVWSDYSQKAVCFF